MKKWVIVVFAGGCIMATAACKKDYLCECTGTGGGITIQWDTLMVDVSKKDAESRCNAMDLTFFGYTQNCELK